LLPLRLYWKLHIYIYILAIKQSSATIDRQPEREEEKTTRERVSERAGVGFEGVEVLLASERGRARARASASARVRAKR